MVKKKKKTKQAPPPVEGNGIFGLKRLDERTAQGAFYGGFFLIFIGFIVVQLGQAYVISYVLYTIGLICAVFAIISVANPIRFVYLYSLLIIYMLLNQGASTDLKSYPVWFFRAGSFALFILFTLIDPARMRLALGQVNWKHPLFWLVAALIISANIITNKPIATFSTSLNLIGYASLAFMLFAYIRSERELKALLEIIVSIGFVVAFWGLFVFYGGLGDKMELGRKTLSTVFYWHNPAAGYFLLIFPICLAMYLSLKNTYQTFQMMWFFFIIFTAFGLTLSRGGWLSSFIPLLLIPLWLHYKGELRFAKLGGRWGQVVLSVALAAFSFILAGVLWAMLYTILRLTSPVYVLSPSGGAFLQDWLFPILLILCALAFFLPPIIRGRFGEVRRKHLNIPARILLLFAVYIACALPISIARPGKFLKPILDRWNQMRIDDFSVVGRFNYYDAGWKMFIDHPVFGTGFETYGYYYPKYQEDPSYYSKDPHNVYLRFVQEGGVIGLGVVAFFLWQFFGLFKKLAKRETGNRLAVFQIGLAAAILGELQHMFLDFDWTFPILPMMVVSYVVILRNTYAFMGDPETIQEKPEPAPKVKPKIGKAQRSPVFLSAVIVAILLTAISSIIGLSYVYQQKADDLETKTWMEKYSEEKGGVDTSGGLPAEIAGQMLAYNTTAAKIFPYNPDALFNLLSAHYYRADYLASTRMATKEQREDFEYNLGEALKYSERLYRVEHHDPKVNYFRGQILLLASGGDEEKMTEAFEFLNRALELNPLNIPKFYIGVADYYFQIGEYENALKILNDFEGLLNSIQDVTEREPDWLNELAGRRLDWIDLPKLYRKAKWRRGQIDMILGETEAAQSSFIMGANTRLPDTSDRIMAFENRYYSLALASIAYNDAWIEEGDRYAIDAFNSYVGMAEELFTNGEYDRALSVIELFVYEHDTFLQPGAGKPGWLTGLTGQSLDWDDIPETYREAQLILGLTYMLKENFEKAKSALKNGAKKVPVGLSDLEKDIMNKDFNLALAQIAYKEGRLDEAGEYMAKTMNASTAYNLYEYFLNRIKPTPDENAGEVSVDSP